MRWSGFLAAGELTKSNRKDLDFVLSIVNGKAVKPLAADKRG
jgi:hypothetical protein